MKARALAAALALAALAGAAHAAPGPVEDTVTVEPGRYYEESVYPPSDGSAWHVSAAAQNGTGPFDVYILASLDLVGAYPGGSFQPVVARENTSLATFDFYAPSRLQSYTLVVDNTDNAREGDAVPRGNLTVRLLRTPPLRSNPEAQAALSAGASVCTAVLAAAAVGVAVYLKRRPRAGFEGELDPSAPRAEVDIEVPKPPRGAWAVEAPEPPQGPEVPK
jgi:hypothetical protein